MQFMHMEKKYVYFSAIVLLIMSTACKAIPPGSIRNNPSLMTSLKQFSGKADDRTAAPCTSRSSPCSSTSDLNPDIDTKRSRKSPQEELPTNSSNSSIHYHPYPNIRILKYSSDSSTRKKRWATNAKRRNMPRNDDLRDSRDARIDITAQFPGKPSQEADKVIEDRLSTLVQRVLDNLETKRQEEDRDEDQKESSTLTQPEMHAYDESDQRDPEKEIEDILTNRHQTKPKVKSAFDCDEWDELRNVCFFDRNIGDTITFVLRFDDLNGGRILNIQWQQEYHIRNTNESKAIDISHDYSVWNVMVGSNGQECRISPITETDFDFNRYTATVSIMTGRGISQNPFIRKISFAVRPVPIDLGFVYPGEQLILNAESFMSLPLESLVFQWFMERDGEKSTLPSNMKVSPTGSCVEISELRKEQEGILVCAVYRVNDIFLTKKRFLIKEITKDILMHGLDRRYVKERGARPRSDILRRTVRQADEEADDNEEQYSEPDDSGVDAGPVELPRIQTAKKVLGSSAMLGTAMRYPITSGAGSSSKDNVLQSPEPRKEVESAKGHGDSNAGQSRTNPAQQTGKTVTEESRGSYFEEKAEDKIAKLLSQCVRSRECSGHASCHQPLTSSAGTCKCHNGYRGNGIFCWEVIVPGRGPVVPSEQKTFRTASVT